MSRNLGRTDCRECIGESEHIVFDEEPRPVKDTDVGRHFFAEYQGLIVAHARCILCHTLYLAWVDWPGSSSSYFRRREEHRFVDLSYRSSFNDEPNAIDLPVYEVEVIRTYVRRPLAGHRYLRFGTEAEVKAWEARRQAAVDAKLSVNDELALIAKATKDASR